MKYCLNCRVHKEYQRKADELKIEFRDRKVLPDLFEEFPEKDMILQIYSDSEVDWDEIKQYNILSRGKLVCCISSPQQAIDECIPEGIRFYLGYPINNFYDLRAALALGVEYVRLDAPIFFNMADVAELGAKVRVVPNVAYLSYLPHEDGVEGTWIRPEDMEIYEPYVAAVEFEDCDVKKEQALYRIYAEQKNWPGEMNMIISNLNFPATNRMILDTLGSARLNCGQRCQHKSSCSICRRTLGLANPELIREYRDTVLNKETDDLNE